MPKQPVRARTPGNLGGCVPLCPMLASRSILETGRVEVFHWVWLQLHIASATHATKVRNL